MAEFAGVREGMTCESEWVVGGEHVASHLAAKGVRVLSTPCMILFIEATLRECLDRVLPEGYTTVGVRIDARHRAPAAEGERVRVRGIVVSVDGKRVLTYAKVTGSRGVIGEAIHERYIVSLEEYMKRLGGSG